MHASGEGLHPLAPYLPRLTIDWVTTQAGDPLREIEGTLAFVDISGFTKLSEGLAKHGKVGAEELTATIDSCFVALLDLAVAFGGRLLKFGGDALLLHFSGEAHEARACRATIEMRRALRVVGRLTVLGQKVSLRMSVGINSGVFHFFLVGDSHRELVVTGPAASIVVAMENPPKPVRSCHQPRHGPCSSPERGGRTQRAWLSPSPGAPGAGRSLRPIRARSTRRRSLHRHTCRPA